MQHPDVENPTIKIVGKFLQSICSPKHRIVLVIDDVQWIDSTSLELLESLASHKDMTGFMLLTTHRDDEVTSEHPFSQTIQNLKHDKDTIITDIHLESLSIETISEMVVDKFPTLAGRGLEALSTVLRTHTKGNAFFVTQILHRLEKSGWKAPEGSNPTGNGDWNSADERNISTTSVTTKLGSFQSLDSLQGIQANT